MHVEVYNSLGEANKREMCAPLPTLSYGYDLASELQDIAARIKEERRNPSDRSPEELLRAVQRSVEICAA